MSRIAPVEPPYSQDVQAVFDRIMPAGVPPLRLFTTLARSERVYRRFNAGSLLDRGTLTLRQRELVIDRTCALNGCAYEWGVHIAFFAERVGLTPPEIEALAAPEIRDDDWPAEEAALLHLCDALHLTSRISKEAGTGSPRISATSRSSNSSPWPASTGRSPISRTGWRSSRKPLARHCPARYREPDSPGAAKRC